MLLELDDRGECPAAATVGTAATGVGLIGAEAVDTFRLVDVDETEDCVDWLSVAEAEAAAMDPLCPLMTACAQ